MNFKKYRYFVGALLKSLVLVISLMPICFASSDIDKSLVIPETNMLITITNGLPTGFFNILYKYNDFVYIGTDGKGIYRIKDGRTTWLPFNNDELTDAKVRVFYLRLGYLYIGTNKGVFRINCNDLIADTLEPAWEKVGKLGLKNKSLSKPGNVGVFLNDVTALVADHDHLFAGTAGGGVFRIKDKESWDWLEMEPSSYKFEVPFNGLRFDGGYLYAAVDSYYDRSGIYRMEYDQNKFKPFLLEKQRVRTFNIFKESDGANLYAAVEGKIFKVKLSSGEIKIIADYKDRVILDIYSDNDNLYFLTPTGRITIKKNLCGTELEEMSQEEPMDKTIMDLLKGYGYAF